MSPSSEHVVRALQERVEIVPYDPDWPRQFTAEAAHLRRVLPPDLIGRIEHFGSTAVPGLPGIAYAWFIKRDAEGQRTHHIHCLEPGSSEWARLVFRDYLRVHPEVAQKYDALKRRIAAQYPVDRVAYAKAKTGFIRRVMKVARQA